MRTWHFWMFGLALFAACLSGPSVAETRSQDPIAWSEGLRWLAPERFDATRLRGKVVILEFWTFECINCRRTIPAMRALDARFHDDVRVVGIHSPELEQERDPRAVLEAVAREGIAYPVALDNNFRVWRRFDNHYWPAFYVLDRRGVVRHTHLGELHQGTPAWSEMLRVVDSLRTPNPRSIP